VRDERWCAAVQRKEQTMRAGYGLGGVVVVVLVVLLLLYLLGAI
jgi:hypothetical protein